MRDAINNNPRVQIAVFAVSAVILGFLMLKTFGGGDAPVSSDPAATATATVPMTIPAVTAPPATADKIPARVGKSGPLEAGPGLPGGFVSAYNDDRAIALLIVSRQAHTDRVLEKYVRNVVGDSAELIVIADDRISDYAAVVDGLGISRTPALVIIRPRNLSGSGPVAEVLYGFRGPRSVRQGIEDALYEGPDRSYSP